jgi:aspartate racemase
MSTLDLPNRIANLSKEQRRLFDARLCGASHASRADRIQRTGLHVDVPLACAQESMWFLQQRGEASSAYNSRAAHRLRGPLDVGALQRSLDAVLERHEALRASFALTDGSPRQTIARPRSVPITRVDLSLVDQNDRERCVADAVRREARRVFDLESGCLLRAALLRLADEDHLLLIVMHHIVADQWSRAVLHRELETLYTSARQGTAAILPDLPIQYPDFAVWQRRRLDSDALAPERSYWKAQLTSAPHVLELPTDYPRPPEQTFAGATHRFLLPAPLVDQLRSLAKAQSATLFMALFAGFAAVLSRWANREDLVIGSASAGRSRVETEPLIGCFINTLALRVDLSGAPSFAELVRRVRSVAVGAYAHAELPFKHLIDAVGVERSIACSPLVQVMFTLQNTLQRPLSLDGLAVEPFLIEAGVSKLDLTLAATETATGLACAIEFRTDLFRLDTVERLASHWQTLLAGAIADPLASVDSLPLMTATEQAQIVEWNRTETAFDGTLCIHELFETQAARTPDAVAVVVGRHSLTYRALDRRSTQLAHYLRARGVGPDVLVGVLVERSPDMLVGLLGILKAGGAYVPLDPAYPPERLAFMLADSAATVLVTQAHLAPPAALGPVVCLDRDWSAIERESLEPVASGVSPTDLAYVIYTSGSTGTPKGVMVEHRNVANLVSAVDAVLGCDPGVWLATASISFDISVLELFWTLARGYRVILWPGARMLQPAGETSGAASEVSVAGLIRAHAVTHLQGTPSLLRMVLLEPGGSEALAGLKRVLTGGEPLSASLVAELGDVPARLIVNMYGPTETTVGSTSWPVKAAAETISIGRPIANTQAYILDVRQRPVPIGVPGELYIGGAGVTRGYLKRPALTAERFVRDPFADAPGARMYRTGDLARYRADGTIEFLGRTDHQVKIRGHRVELGEIEAALRRWAGVQEGVVVVRNDAAGNARLVAYVVTKGAVPATQDLRGFLRAQLPDYMVPSQLVEMQALPLTPNGKIDRAALPISESGDDATTEGYVAPRTASEHELARIWCEMLGIDRIGVHDGFFDCGGHSLVAMRLLHRVREQLGIDMPLRTLFEFPTIAALAAIIDQQLIAPPPVAPDAEEREEIEF